MLSHPVYPRSPLAQQCRREQNNLSRCREPAVLSPEHLIPVRNWSPTPHWQAVSWPQARSDYPPSGDSSVTLGKQ